MAVLNRLRDLVASLSNLWKMFNRREKLSKGNGKTRAIMCFLGNKGNHGQTWKWIWQPAWWIIPYVNPTQHWQGNRLQPWNFLEFLTWHVPLKITPTPELIKYLTYKQRGPKMQCVSFLYICFYDLWNWFTVYPTGVSTVVCSSLRWQLMW